MNKITNVYVNIKQNILQCILALLLSTLSFLDHLVTVNEHVDFYAQALEFRTQGPSSCRLVFLSKTAAVPRNKS